MKRKEKKNTFFGCPQEKTRRKEEKKKLSFGAANSLSYRIFFPGNQHASWNASTRMFSKRDVHKCILHCHDDSLGMLFFFKPTF